MPVVHQSSHKPTTCTTTPASSPVKQIPRLECVLTRKENSPWDNCHHPQYRMSYLRYPRAGYRLLTAFPFDKQHAQKNIYFKTELSYLLGSTNSCPIAVHMKPFSTSVFKVFIWIVATTTKICTMSCSSRAHAQTFCTFQQISNKTDSLKLTRPPTQCKIVFFALVSYKLLVSAPSIFKASEFGKWVVTHSLEGSDFHGHLPAVKIH